MSAQPLHRAGSGEADLPEVVREAMANRLRLAVYCLRTFANVPERRTMAALSTEKPYLPDFASIAVDMRSTCIHHSPMSTMIQIRDVPETLHRQLKSRAALAGMSLSGYLLDEIRRIASQPTLGELRARLAQRSAVDPSVPPADAVRAERDRP